MHFRRMIFVGALLLFSFTAKGATHVYSQFETGVGQWQTKGVKYGERKASYTASMTMGIAAGHRAPFGFIRADSTRLIHVPYQGPGPDLSQRRHEIEGLGLGIGWQTQRYIGWLGYGGGRWRVIGEESSERFPYRSPFVGLGIRIYQSSIASIAMLYNASRLQPKNSWYDEYGFKDAWLQNITIAIQLQSQD